MTALRTAVLLAGLCACWVAGSFLLSSPYYVLLMALVPIWAAFGTSWNLFSGYSGLVSFGHAAFFGIGAYLVTLGLVRGLTPWGTIPLAAGAGALAGLAIGSVTFRLRGSYFALAMLAYPLMLAYLFAWFGYQEMSVPLHREFAGGDLLRHRPHERAHLGIAHVPEGRRVFASLSVGENLEMGGATRAGRAARARTFEHIFSLFPILAERRDQAAGTLSGGQQQMLAIGRALASCPRLLMLDEPSMGLSPAMADTIFDAVRRIRTGGAVTVLLVEQRVMDALRQCDRGYVLESGRVVLHGSASDLSPARLRRAYLGV